MCGTETNWWIQTVTDFATPKFGNKTRLSVGITKRRIMRRYWTHDDLAAYMIRQLKEVLTNEQG